MKTMAIVAFVVFVALDVVTAWILSKPKDIIDSIPMMIASLAITGVVQNFFKTPLAIAIHRFIILDEKARGYAVWPLNRRFMRFFGFLTLFSLLASALPVALALAKAVGLRTDVTVLIGIVGFLFTLAMVFIMVRAIVLFPAIAIDAADTRLETAIESTEGLFWRIFGMGLLTAIPLGLAERALIFAVQEIEFGDIVTAVIGGAIGSVSSFFTIIIMVAIASRLYLALDLNALPPVPKARIS